MEGNKVGDEKKSRTREKRPHLLSLGPHKSQAAGRPNSASTLIEAARAGRRAPGGAVGHLYFFRCSDATCRPSRHDGLRYSLKEDYISTVLPEEN